MAGLQAVGRLEEGFRVRVQTGGHEYVLDEPVDNGGSAQGAIPGEVLLAALTGCQAMVARLYFNKVGMEPRSVEVTAEIADSPSAPMGRFSPEFNVVMEVDSDLTDEQMSELSALVDAKCAVGTIIREKNPIKFNVRRA